MRYRKLGRTNLDVSVLALGCGNFGGIGSVPELFGRGDDERAAFAVLDAALAAGITMFDTANSYGGGRSEAWLGQWLTSRGVRDDVVVATKVRSPVGPRPEDAGLSARHIREQADASLRRLGTDRIDLYLAHGPDPSTPVEETVGAFDELVRAGKVLHFGVSNFGPDELRDLVAAADRLGAARPVNLQSGYNLLEREAADDLFGVCAGFGIGFTAYSPLAGGWLTGKYRAHQPFPAGSRMTLRPDPYGHLDNDATFAALDRLAAAAAARDVSISALALAWALAEPRVTALVVGPRTPGQLNEMCAALDVPLTSSERAALTRIAADGHP